MKDEQNNESGGRFPVTEAVFYAGIEDYAPETKDALTWVYETAKKEGWSLGYLDRETKRSKGVWGKVLKGRYDSSMDGPTTWALALRREHELKQGAEKPDFIVTELVEAVDFATAKAIAAQCVSIVVGPKGIGKTWALKWSAAKQGSSAHYFRCPPNLSYSDFLRRFSRSLGGPSKGSILALTDAIHERVGGWLKAIVIDEMHELFETCRGDVALRICEMLRELHDELGVALVLSGTAAFRSALTEGRFQAGLAQLSDRGNLWVELDGKYKAKDLRKFYDHYGLGAPTGAATSLVRDVLKIHTMRRLCFHLQDGARLAHNVGEEYTWEHFEDAFNLVASYAKKAA